MRKITDDEIKEVEKNIRGLGFYSVADKMNLLLSVANAISIDSHRSNDKDSLNLSFRIAEIYIEDEFKSKKRSLSKIVLLFVGLVQDYDDTSIFSSLETSVLEYIVENKDAIIEEEAWYRRNIPKVHTLIEYIKQDTKDTV